jgi:hypothetical protein
LMEVSRVVMMMEVLKIMMMGGVEDDDGES